MKILPLKVNNLNYLINENFILKNINLSINDENITIILGNNGAGKSSLLNALHDLIKVPKNTITWNNLPTSSIKIMQSMVFQTPILFNRSVYDNLDYIKNKKKVLSKYCVEKIIEKLNIKNIENINAKYLSGGEKQKVSIGMALIGEPKIIFLDEPTSHLDPQYKHEIENIIKVISTNGIKVIMTSHDVSQIKRIGEEIIFLNKGEIIYHNSIKKFINASHCDIIKNYIMYG